MVYVENLQLFKLFAEDELVSFFLTAMGRECPETSDHKVRNMYIVTSAGIPLSPDGGQYILAEKMVFTLPMLCHSVDCCCEEKSGDSVS